MTIAVWSLAKRPRILHVYYVLCAAGAYTEAVGADDMPKTSQQLLCFFLVLDRETCKWKFSSVHLVTSWFSIATVPRLSFPRCTTCL
ncbi:hypothetical protein TKK_0001658 [Trichogramma kaykai]